MRRFLFFVFIYLSALQLKSQTPFTKSWDFRYGGDYWETPCVLFQTLDHGYFAGGYTATQNIGFDKSDTGRGGVDYWIVKTDSLGILLWAKTFGGSGDDYLSCGMALPDSGFLIGGVSQSGISGDKTVDNYSPAYDFWIIRIDKNGNKIWDRVFGGDNQDGPFAMTLTPDGNYFLGGHTYSDSSFDISHHSYGSNDFWIIKIDSNGNKIWDKNYGGSGNDVLKSICITSDHGFILGGESYSPADGCKSQPSINSSDDYWIIRIDSNGTKLWDKTFGGDQADYFQSMAILPGDKIYLGGFSWSQVGFDKSVPNHSPVDSDYWIVGSDGSGNKLWDNVYGGTSPEDDMNIITSTDQGLLLIGTSYSNASGDKSENNIFNVEQPWAIAIDTLGNKLWDKTVPTSTHVERCYGLQTNDGCFAFLAEASTIGGDVSQIRNSDWDYWLVKYCSANNLQANFASSSSALCQNTCLSFTNYSQNATSYNWYFPGGTPSTDTSANPQGICYNTAGTFNVALVVSNGNGSDTLIRSNYITVYPQVQFAPLTQNWDTLFSVPGYSSYQWYLNATLINGANNYFYIAPQSGDYSVVVTDSNGCNATAQLINVIASARDIHSTFDYLKIRISTENIYLNIHSITSSISKIELTDALGKVIYQKNINLQVGENEIEISKREISKGIYFVKILNDDKNLTEKIFVR